MTDEQAKVAELDLRLRRDGSGMWTITCRRLDDEFSGRTLMGAAEDMHATAAHAADQLRCAAQHLNASGRKRLELLTALCDALIELQAGGK